jgi:hypothetical protein
MSSLDYVKAHAIAARAEKDLGKKLDAIASALEELANALASKGATGEVQRRKKGLFA